jgi:Na+/melibiose symporter-like transporter
MYGYMVLPVVTLTGILSLATFPFVSGTPADHKNWGGLAGILIWLIVAMVLNNRLARYLRVPPTLAIRESAADKELIQRFRVVSVGMFVLTCFAAFLQYTYQSRLSTH